MVKLPLVRAPVITSEELAHLCLSIAGAVHTITPARHRVVYTKIGEALVIECLASSTRAKSVVRPGDVIEYVATSDRVGTRATSRYQCTSEMCVERITPRMVIDKYGRRARHESILAIIRD